MDRLRGLQGPGGRCDLSWLLSAVEAGCVNELVGDGWTPRFVLALILLDEDNTNSNKHVLATGLSTLGICRVGDIRPFLFARGYLALTAREHWKRG